MSQEYNICESCGSKMDEHPTIKEFLDFLRVFKQRHPSFDYEVCGNTCSRFHIAVSDSAQQCVPPKTRKVKLPKII